MDDWIHVPATLPPEKIVGTDWMGGWVSPRAGFGDMEQKKSK